MSRLILLNGPPACGKSTLAQHWVNEHPMTLNLDIDIVRALIGRWQDAPTRSGTLARAIAMAAARAHLESGNDVIAPQHLGRPQFIEQLERLAADVGAEFREVMLLDSRENTFIRFAERTSAARASEHTDAHHLLESMGGQSELDAMYNRSLAIIASRPQTLVVRSEAGKLDETYQLLGQALK
ncbi:Predicted kinase [Frankineae bacterium MT45]|nr:Predicted kinase [Frankineae bacterium MT45]